MKLRTKITAVAALVILIAAAISDGVIWSICRRSMLGEAKQTLFGQTVMLQSKYEEFQMHYQGTLRDAERRFFFKQYGSDYVICLRGKQEIFNQTVLTPEDLQNMKLSNQHYGQPAAVGEMRIRGHSLLITKIEQPDALKIYVVYDLADVTRRLRRLALGMLGVLLGVGIPAVIVLHLLLCRTMKPFGVLSDSAKQIAAGAYEKRAEISSRDEIGLLAKDFNKMADAVQDKIAALTDSEKRKTMFMADFSHELKTPLTAISGYAQTLRTVNLSVDDQEEALGYIYSESRRLDRLAKKMMRLMQLDRTESLQMTEIDCQSLLDSVLATCKPIAEHQGIRLQTARCSGAVQGDFDLLHDALCNLTENAVKASTAGQTVTLCAENGMITVRDEGCGIPADEIKNLTEPFYMVDKSRSRSAGGAGLGLSIVRMILQLHGADMAIESTVGKGTDITLKFPQ